MTERKRIRLTLVEGAGPASDSGLWNHPDYEPGLFKDPRWWESLGRTLEDAGFDAIFFADTPAIRADSPAAREHHLRNGGLPRLDPAYVIPIIAAVTERLGFVVTSSITYDHPVPLARKFATLDHLTDGRIGWNVVATNVRSAALNHGLREQLPHDVRYDRGDEFMAVVYALWNHAWDDDAVVRDVERGVYVDPERVRPLSHHGEWFRVEGIPITAPSPQRTPVLYQAGSSDRGRRFAATHAECVYLNTQSAAETAHLVADVRRRARATGRAEEDLKFFPRIIPVVGGTEAEARAKYDDYLAHDDEQAAIVTLQQWAGLDLSGRDPEELLDLSDLQVAGISSEHAADYLRRQARAGERMTVRELVRRYAFTGGAGNVVLGTPEQVADQLERYMDETGVDGFNVAWMIRRHSVRDFAEHVIPELRRRGRIPQEPAAEPAGTTMRERLFDAGARPHPRHPAARRPPTLLP